MTERPHSGVPGERTAETLLRRQGFTIERKDNGWLVTGQGFSARVRSLGALVRQLDGQTA